jgi:6-pyruvoyltetrahydropterin/6-carboxytetrahydropterin synthase
MMLSIDGWKAGLMFSACHMIPKHHKCSRLHGHTYTVHAKIHGETDSQHLVLDFGIIKKTLKAVAKQLDHHLLIPTKNSNTNIIDLDDLTYLAKNHEVAPMTKGPLPGYYEVIILNQHYVFPKSDVLLLDVPSTTAEEMAKYFLQTLLSSLTLPKNVTELEIGLDEGWGQGAWVKKVLR